MLWHSKSVFLASRGFIATLGLVRTCAIIRLLSLPDYALIGVVESLRQVLSTAFGFGVADSLSREGSVEKDVRRKGQLIATAYANALLLTVPAGVAFLGVALVGQDFYSDSRLTNFLVAGFLLTVIERVWLMSLATLRVMYRHRAFMLFEISYAILNTGLSISLVAAFGAHGFYYAPIVSGSALLLGILFVISQKAHIPALAEFLGHWKDASSRLWGVSWFMYMYKGSLTLWRRLPILVSASLIPPHLLGAVSAALDLGFKIHLLHQALSPLIIPKLSHAFADSFHRYDKMLRREVKDVVVLNVAGFTVAILAWHWLAPLLFTHERSDVIGRFFYFVLLIEATLVVANVVYMCILVPTKQFVGISAPTMALRLATIPLLYALLIAGLDDAWLVLFSMFVTGALVAMLYGLRARMVLRTMVVA